ncbi:MAG: T9SS type A sorting domain-containing protein [Bacteriodetes bacterium]|nr:T9SS type A sorting domain-containing protein [Bacteroidota bacterium]
MKTLLWLLLFLIAGQLMLAQKIKLSINPESKDLIIGENAEFTINIVPLNGFNGTIFLSVITDFPNGTVKLSNQYPNPPYSNIKMTVSPGVKDTGNFTISIRADNQGFLDIASCYVRIKPDNNWTIVPIPHGFSTSGIGKPFKYDRDSNITVSTVLEKTNKHFLIHHFINTDWKNDTIPIGYSLMLNSQVEYCIDNSDNIWFNIPSGMFRYNQSYVSLYNTQNSNISSSPSHLLQPLNKSGVASKCKDVNLLNIFSGSDWIQLPLKPIQLKNRNGIYYNNFIIRNNVELLVPSNTGILSIIDTVQKPIWINDSSVASEDNVRLFLGKNDTVYTLNKFDSTYRVIRLFGNSWELRAKDIPARINGSNYNVSTFYVDDYNNYYIGTNMGLLYTHMGVWKIFNPFGNKNSYVTDVIKDKYENIWMMISEKGIYVYNPNGLKNIPINHTTVDIQSGEYDFIRQESIQPNPAQDQILISGFNSGECIVYDILGKIVYQCTFNTTVVLNTSQFQSGIYFCKIGDKVTPFVVQH